ncbi:hypothetical protein EVAR_35570_1 [Eumeta japonica]|uniref:Uncharacterized protein n=1 Tax=Eumeta variegata TaxID=151549 RepID=A0A4C1XK75_EUMVA|nr:hypothetical protein EVAR_35570_1 [Eumeta japonica]
MEILSSSKKSRRELPRPGPGCFATAPLRVKTGQAQTRHERLRFDSEVHTLSRPCRPDANQTPSTRTAVIVDSVKCHFSRASLIPDRSGYVCLRRHEACVLIRPELKNHWSYCRQIKLALFATADRFCKLHKDSIDVVITSKLRQPWARGGSPSYPDVILTSHPLGRFCGSDPPVPYADATKLCR